MQDTAHAVRAFIVAPGKLTKKKTAELADALEKTLADFGEWDGDVTVNVASVERIASGGVSKLERHADERRRIGRIERADSL